MPLNTDSLAKCVKTLENALQRLEKVEPGSDDFELYRYAVVKGFELALEISGKLLKKALKPYFGSPKSVDQLVFKDVFRHAAKHGILTLEEVERWYVYRDNRNDTAHDYGEKFAQETLRLVPLFVTDVKNLKTRLDEAGT